MIAERFGLQRCTLWPKVERHRDDGRPVALFLCVHGAGLELRLDTYARHIDPAARTATPTGWSAGLVAPSPTRRSIS